MGMIAKDKEIVVPGEVLAQGMDFLPSFGTYRQEDKIIANKLGLLTIDGKVLKTIPLSGRYLPKRGDVIIGRVIDIGMSGWRLDTNSPYSAMLNVRDASYDFLRNNNLSKIFGIGDFVVTKIVKVTSQNLVDLSCKGPGLKKLRAGRIIEVNTNKVPRIIGKKGSMVSMIKQATDCKITVGQNGLVWIQGEPDKEILAVKAVKKIESEAHMPGLTERMKEYLEKESGVKIQETPEEHSNDSEDGE